MKKLITGINLVVATVLAAGLLYMPTPGLPKVEAASQPHVPPHFILNQGPTLTEQTAAANVGFNYMDVASKAVMDLLPANVKGVYYIGNGYNTTCSWTLSDAQVQTIVQNNLGDSHFSGIYYISDEPHTATCPGGPQALADRTALIKSIDPSAKTFAVIQWSAATNEYANFANAVDYIGADPYPCNANSVTCDNTSLTSKVSQAVAAVGAARVVPVFQAFGQQCNTGSSHFYRQPSESELQSMMNVYDSLVPSWQRPFDAAYGWRNQSTACPTLKDANGTAGSPNLQAVFSNYFASMQPVTITTAPDADTYVASATPTSNFGDQTTMCANTESNGWDYRPLVKLTVNGVGNRSVLSADLSLHVYNGTADAVTVRRVDDQTWAESDVTWDNRPQSGAIVATIPGVTTGSTMQLDLSQVITGDGVYSLEFQVQSPDSLCLDTKEAVGAVMPSLTIIAQK